MSQVQTQRARHPRSSTTFEHEATPVAASLSPERATLADAIARLAEHELSIEETKQAVHQATVEGEAASMAQWEAEKALERAMPRKAQESFTPSPQPTGAFWGIGDAREAHLVANASPPTSISDARDALAKATDVMGSAERMLQFHKDRLKMFQEQLHSRRAAVRDAVRAVVRADPATLTLVNECRRLHTMAASAARAVQHATNNDTIQHGSLFYGYDSKSTFDQDPESWAASLAWHEALERLAHDATTPLPVIKITE